MWPNTQVTEEIYDEKLHFLCSAQKKELIKDLIFLEKVLAI